MSKGPNRFRQTMETGNITKAALLLTRKKEMLRAAFSLRNISEISGNTQETT